MDTKRVVIVGAGVAGHSVADELRDHGVNHNITLINGEQQTPYDRPPLSKTFLSSAESAAVPLREENWARSRHISQRTGILARALDVAARTVQLSDGSELEYNSLAICTGVQARQLPRHLNLPGVHTLRTVQDAQNLRSQVRAGGHAVVVGAGFLGLEVAASLKTTGSRVTVLCRDATPLGHALGESSGDWFSRLHSRNGVTLMLQTCANAITGSPGSWRIETSTGEVLAADLIIAAIGTEPNVSWLVGSGLAMDGGILCNQYCETKVKGIVAAGDVARRLDPRAGRYVRSEHWSNSAEMGRVAARTLLGDREHYAPLPYFWTDQYSARGRFAGRRGDDERVLESAPNRLVVEYVEDGKRCGIFAVNSPREFVRARRELAA